MVLGRAVNPASLPFLAVSFRVDGKLYAVMVITIGVNQRGFYVINLTAAGPGSPGWPRH
jgi:hypothetical protein